MNAPGKRDTSDAPESRKLRPSQLDDWRSLEADAFSFAAEDGDDAFAEQSFATPAVPEFGVPDETAGPAELETLSSQLAEVSRQLADSDARAQSLAEDMRGAVAGLREEFSRLEKRVGSSRAALSKQVSAMSEQLAHGDTQAQSLSEGIRQAIVELREEFFALEKRVSSSHAGQAQALSAQLSEVSSELLGEYADLQKRVASGPAADVDALSFQLSELGERLTGGDAQVHQLIGDVRKGITALRDELAGVGEGVANQTADANALCERLSALCVEFAGVEKRADLNHAAELDALSLQLSALSKQVTGSDANFRSLAEQVRHGVVGLREDMQRHTSELHEELSDLRQRTEMSPTQDPKLTKQISKLGEHLSASDAQVKSLAQDIERGVDRVREEVSGLERRFIERNSTDMQSLSAQLSQVSKQMSGSDAHVLGLVEEVQRTAFDLRQEIADLEGRESENRATDVAKLSKQLSQLNSQLAGSNAHVLGLAEEVQRTAFDLRESITDMEERITSSIEEATRSTQQAPGSDPMGAVLSHAAALEALLNADQLDRTALLERCRKLRSAAATTAVPKLGHTAAAAGQSWHSQEIALGDKPPMPRVHKKTKGGGG